MVASGTVKGLYLQVTLNSDLALAPSCSSLSAVLAWDQMRAVAPPATVVTSLPESPQVRAHACQSSVLLVKMAQPTFW